VNHKQTTKVYIFLPPQSWAWDRARLGWVATGGPIIKIAQTIPLAVAVIADVVVWISLVVAGSNLSHCPAGDR